MILCICIVDWMYRDIATRPRIWLMLRDFSIFIRWNWRNFSKSYRFLENRSNSKVSYGINAGGGNFQQYFLVLLVSRAIEKMRYELRVLASWLFGTPTVKSITEPIATRSRMTISKWEYECGRNLFRFEKRGEHLTLERSVCFTCERVWVVLRT